MSGKNEKPLTAEELDWIQLRNELDEIRGKEVRKSALSKETWYIPAGLVVTTTSFLYGLYHMDHPVKSIFGAYTRIFSQGFTAIGCAYVFLKFNKEGKKKKINMEYTD